MEEIEILPESRAARIRAIEPARWRVTNAASVRDLFRYWEHEFGGYNPEISIDGLIGVWRSDGYLSVDKTATIAAVYLDGAVYRCFLNLGE